MQDAGGDGRNAPLSSLRLRVVIYRGPSENFILGITKVQEVAPIVRLQNSPFGSLKSKSENLPTFTSLFPGQRTTVPGLGDVKI